MTVRICKLPMGKIVADEWVKSAQIRNELRLDEWIVMPNHFHAIVTIIAYNHPYRGDRPVAPTAGTAGITGARIRPIGPGPKSVGALMAGFKSATVKRINQFRNMPGVKIWQNNYWEHVIRNEIELFHIRRYIETNPCNWDNDKLNDRFNCFVNEESVPYGEMVGCRGDRRVAPT
jgi:putative transposase